MRGLHAARVALVLAGLAACGQAVAGENVIVRLAEYGATRMPSGLASLCNRQPQLCAIIAPARQSVELTPAQLDMVARVNRAINHAIASTTDEKLYGRVEYWTLPGHAGDCEDYVLLKRTTLAARGIPLAALLITVVQDENGEGHAVLGLATTQGDLVLDNRRDEILPWNVTGYRFVKRQSASDPNIWVSLAPEELQATNIASGPEAQSHE